MILKNTRLFKGFAAFIITVAILYIGQMAWQKYAINLPLDSALKNITGVEKADWDADKKINSAVKINITLGGIDNFQKTYNEINANIEHALQGKTYKLNIKDNRTPELENLYYEIQLYVQKSIVDGNFPLLMDKVKEIAKNNDAIGKVYVDKDNVYIQIMKDKSFLYELIVRDSVRTGGY